MKKQEKKIEKQAEKKKSPIFLYLLLAMLIIILLIALPQKGITCYKEVTKTEVEKQAYVDTEPYTYLDCSDVNLKSVIEWGNKDTDCINEICDRNEQYCVDYNWLNNCVRYADRCTHYACTRYQMDCELKISNIDDTAGTWKIDGYSWNRELNKKEDFIKTLSVYVNPTRNNVASWSFTYDAGESMSCWYILQFIPTKEVCENIIRYRDVTKYRDVEVTKTVQEAYTKKTNWIYGNCED